MKGEVQAYTLWPDAEGMDIRIPHVIQPLSVAFQHSSFDSSPVVFCLVDYSTKLPTGLHRFRWVTGTFNTDTFGSTVFQFVGTLIANNAPRHLFYLGNEYDAT